MQLTSNKQDHNQESEEINRKGDSSSNSTIDKISASTNQYPIAAKLKGNKEYKHQNVLTYYCRQSNETLILNF